MRFTEAREKAEEKGWTLEKIDGVNVIYGGLLYWLFSN